MVGVRGVVTAEGGSRLNLCIMFASIINPFEH